MGCIWGIVLFLLPPLLPLLLHRLLEFAINPFKHSNPILRPQKSPRAKELVVYTSSYPIYSTSRNPHFNSRGLSIQHDILEPTLRSHFKILRSMLGSTIVHGE
ncbi:hypothetical protein DL98DRAFT_57607 [Cadophora sp. DSE1049]|nr:hypothetical protein DL98DRAFT_57607 [Cadophora sp. DSE1049]